MQKWEYMWIYVARENGANAYIANGERLSARTYVEALNVMGQQGWELVSILNGSPQGIFSSEPVAQFCLKRPVAT